MPPIDQNPYASPSSEPDPPASDLAAGLRTTIWEIVLAWEKLRIAYLLWLSLVSLAMFALVGIGQEQFRDWRFWLTLGFGFVGANICFTAGHLLEISLALLGMPREARQWLRGVVFVLGTFFATALTAAVVVAATLGDVAI